MKININFDESPENIEKTFNDIKTKITKCVLDRTPRIPPENLFGQLDTEFEKVSSKYKSKNNQINLLYIEHNYFWCKLFQYLHDNPTKSMRLFLTSLHKLSERYSLRPYANSSFEKMLKTYQVALIKIKEQRNEINFDIVRSEFVKFITNTYYISPIFLGMSANIMKNLIGIIFEEEINEISDVDHLKSLANGIECILKLYEEPLGKNLTGSFLIASLCHELLYRAKKKIVFSLVKSEFFEQSENTQEKIKHITKELLSHTKESCRLYQKYVKKLPSREQNDKHTKLIVTLKKIDRYSAEYYNDLYNNKDIYRAWSGINKIKEFLVIKMLKENIPLTDNLLSYYKDEWLLVDTFVKIHLLKNEINKKQFNLKQDWEKDIFKEIIRSLYDVEKIFKYQSLAEKDYTLQPMTSTFSGHFSEYFLYELIQSFFEHGKIVGDTPDYYRDLFVSIKSAKSKNDIVLNYSVENGDPDIDIYIKKQCAIFLKNSEINSKKEGEIWDEMEVCHNEGIIQIFYCINFMKNLGNIEYIIKIRNKIKTNYSSFKIVVFDIEDIVSNLIDELNRSHAPKPNFSKQDVYKVLGY